MVRDFQLVIFDWDGTLVNSVDWIVECIQVAAQTDNLDQPNASAIHDVIGMSLSGAMRTLFPAADEEQVQRLVKHYRGLYLSRQISPEDLFPGVESVLQSLIDAGKTLAVATGKGRAGLDKAMQGTGLGHFFQTSRCADETHSKPNPHMIFELMRETGFDSDQTIMIGDSILDLEMAHKAQTASVGVTYGVHDRTRLQQWNPIAVVDTISELLSD